MLHLKKTSTFSIYNFKQTSNMQVNTAILILVLLLPFSTLSLYTMSQQFDHGNFNLGIDFTSNDTSFTVSGNQGKGFIYDQVNETATFEGRQFFEDSSLGVLTSILLSSDGMWRVICSTTADIVIEKWNSTTEQYDEKQRLNDGETSSKTCCLAEDGSVFAYQSQTIAHIYQLNFTSELFTKSQQIIKASLTKIDLSSDGRSLSLAEHRGSVFIYNHNGSSFVEEQEIVTENTQSITRNVYLNDDDYLVIPDYNAEREILIKIYKRNSTSLFDLVSTTNFGALGYASHLVSQDSEIIVLQKSQSVSIITGVKENNLTIVDQIPGSYYSTISPNNKYIALTTIGGIISIYVDCSYDGNNQTVFNANLSTCQLCDEDLNKFLITSNSSTTCELCTIQHCVDCLNLTSCEECDSSQGYYMDGGSCSYCNASNLSYLDNGNCLVCDQQNYFLVNSSCQMCQLEGCLECESLSACLICDENNTYTLDNQTKTCQKEDQKEQEEQEQETEEKLLPYEIGLISAGCVIVAGVVGYIIFVKVNAAKVVTAPGAQISGNKISNINVEQIP